MTRAYFICWRIALALIIPTAIAQQCYYPNGEKAPEKPCSSADGSACCPDKWECLDNGLCHYPPDKLFGRYSCTDQSWKAEGCPSNLCTYNMKDAIGGESITQCADHNNQWCCNADAQHVNCCKESPAPRPFFALADGKAYATVGGSTAPSAPNLATITGKASGTDSGPSETTTGSGSPQSTNPPSTTPASSDSGPTTQLQTSLSSGTAGIVTVIRTVVSTPSATNPPSGSPDSKKSNLPVIVGCAVGIPLALALLGILFWLLRKRSRENQLKDNRTSKPPFADEILTDGSPHSEHSFVGGVKHNEKPPMTTYAATDGVSELADNGVGPGRPISTLNGRAELDSGATFQPGAQPPHSPHLVGLGGGTGHTPHSSWSSAPNGNSAAVPASVLAGYSEADSRPVSTAATGLPRPISGPPPGGYVPYRPNNLSHPEAQELSTVNTPPAVELSSVRTPPA